MPDLSRRQFLGALGLGAAGLAVRGRAAERPPNIVFVFADDLGWMDLGCYGNRYNESPRLDHLAAEGVRFTDFYAAAPVCSPARASVLSGQAPARLRLTAHIPGHWRPFEKLAEPPTALCLPPCVTVADQLRAAGYATGHFGKWHLNWRRESLPQDRGFDTAVTLGGHDVPGQRQVPPTDHPRRMADYIADRAVDFISDHRDQPFFVHFCPQAVHIPLSTTPELRRKYTLKPGVPGYLSHPLYAGLVEELDQATGKLLDTLERLGLADNTLFVFSSDNGGLEVEAGGWPGTTNDPLRNEKGTVYEGGIRVPTIVRWPGVTRPGTVCDEPACTTDFLPTFVHAAGRETTPGQPLDGLDLKPVLTEPTAELARDALYWHYPHYHHGRPAGAIRAREWKAIEQYDTGEVELYRLSEDLGEETNLAAAQPAKAKELAGRLQAWRHEVNAQLPQLNPAYDPQRSGEWWSRMTVQPTKAPGYYEPPQ